MIMKIGPLPDALRTPARRPGTGFHCVRTESVGSWRSGWPGTPGPWCWWCRR